MVEHPPRIRLLSSASEAPPSRSAEGVARFLRVFLSVLTERSSTARLLCLGICSFPAVEQAFL